MIEYPCENYHNLSFLIIKVPQNPITRSLRKTNYRPLVYSPYRQCIHRQIYIYNLKTPFQILLFQNLIYIQFTRDELSK